MTVAIVKPSRNTLLQLTSTEVVGSVKAEEAREIASWLNVSDEVWIGMKDGKVCGFWGIILPTLISDRAYLWLHTTDALDGNEFLFVRHSQIFIKELLKEHPLIVGHCIRGERKPLRWLQWLGAKFQRPQGKLVPFEIRAA